LRGFRAAGAAAGLLLLSFCRPAGVLITPIPADIRSIEGYASLRIEGVEGKTRGKFAFLVRLPDRARVEVTGALGKSLYRIVIRGGEAFLVIPSRKVYWRSTEEEVLDAFLGFRLRLPEMFSLLTGRWEESGLLEEEGGAGWELVRDRSGRIVSGRRGELSFEVQEFIDDTPFVRGLVFKHSRSEGRLKVLSLGLNKPTKEGAFSTGFLERYAPKTWPEIRELLEDAR